MEAVLLKGDLSKLTESERVRLYGEVCKSLGLNPLTQPFAYVTLSGRLTLYALRNCADQLRKIHNVTLEIVSRTVVDDLLTIHVRARTPDGRMDEDLGIVSLPSTLRGEARANAELKAVTKAKRRATLSICGLGWLDETEVADIPTMRRPDLPPITPPPHRDENIGTPHSIPVLSDADWRPFGEKLIAEVRGATDAAVIAQWLNMNAANLATMAGRAAKLHATLMRSIGAHQQMLATPALTPPEGASNIDPESGEYQ
jgi:hypothetical protein